MLHEKGPGDEFLSGSYSDHEAKNGDGIESYDKDKLM